MKYQKLIDEFTQKLQDKALKGSYTEYSTCCEGNYISYSLNGDMRSVIHDNTRMGIVTVAFPEKHFLDMLVRRDGRHWFVRVLTTFKFTDGKHIECYVGIIMV